MNPNVPTLQGLKGFLEASPVPLIQGLLCKVSNLDKEEGPWSFMGIASDESEDLEGDAILKKSLDLSYACKRGYVNWDHSRLPEDQIGFLSTAEIIDGNRLKRVQEILERPLSKTASVYVEGELYRYVPRAIAVKNLMKSTAETAGMGPGVGVSLDGVVARDAESRGVLKAFVRGVALSQVPTQTNTLAVLKKSLLDYYGRQGEEEGQLLRTTGMAELTLENLGRDVEELKKSLDEMKNGRKLNRKDAIFWVLEQRPKWTYDLASKLVDLTFKNSGRE